MLNTELSYNKKQKLKHPVKGLKIKIAIHSYLMHLGKINDVIFQGNVQLKNSNPLIFIGVQQCYLKLIPEALKACT